MNQKTNILIVGGSMYIAGRGTNSDGTIMPAVLEGRRQGGVLVKLR